MKSRTLLATAAVAALALGSAPAMAAPVLIDNFNTSQSLTAMATGPATNSNGVTGSTSDLIGGARLAQIAITSGMGSATFNVNNSNTGPGQANYSNQFSVQSNLLLNWNGGTSDITSHTGLGGIDLTGGGTNSEILVSYSSDLGALGTVTVYSGDGSSSSSRSWNFTGGGTLDTANLGFGTFSGTADFTDVSAITLSVDGVSNFDGMLDIISAPGTNVPEPMTLSLLGFGLLGVGYVRRRSKKA